MRNFENIVFIVSVLITVASVLLYCVAKAFASCRPISAAYIFVALLFAYMSYRAIKKWKDDGRD